MSGSAGVAVGGLGLLTALAVLIALRVDREARHEAWQRIATARRINAETLRRLERREVLLDLREEELEVWDRRLDLRETRFLEREEMLASYEEKLGQGR